MLGYADSEDDALVSITITVIPTSGKLVLDGVTWWMVPMSRRHN